MRRPLQARFGRLWRVQLKKRVPGGLLKMVFERPKHLLLTFSTELV
jgi:hypothetical protein